MEMNIKILIKQYSLKLEQDLHAASRFALNRGVIWGIWEV
jgi:hypothetical protein